jgi:hypothetical protein
MSVSHSKIYVNSKGEASFWPPLPKVRVGPVHALINNIMIYVGEGHIEGLKFMIPYYEKSIPRCNLIKDLRV